MKLTQNVLAVAVLLLTAVAGAADDPPFPRLAGTNIGSPHNYYDPGYQAQLARLNFSVLNYWPGWGGRGAAMEKVIRGIKAINPNSKVFLYHTSAEVADDNAALRSYRDTVNRMNWWASTSAGKGGRVLSAFGERQHKPSYVLNNTLYSRRDSAGQQMWEWDVRWTVDHYAKPIPSIDGLFEDNVFWRPRVDADWNGDGIIDSRTSSNAGAWLRQGYRKRFELLNWLMPGKYQLGNVADWGEKTAVLTDLEGALNGGIIEGILGTTYSVEKRVSWAEMMRWYRKTSAAIAPPKLVAFNQHGATNDYQAMRYGLASCLMDDGYYSFTDATLGYTGVVWFDEFDAKLGQAKSLPPTGAWQKGVFRRDFEHGIALVNPKGNGPATVTLETDFVRLAGKQDPSVNNGRSTKSVTLRDRDGIILMRKDAARPASRQARVARA